jgi:hypothetical protein
MARPGGLAQAGRPPGRLRDPAALPGWLATTTQRECGHILAPPFSRDDQYGNNIDGLTISLEPARAG